MALANNHGLQWTLLFGVGALVSVACAGKSASHSEAGKDALTRPPAEVVVLSRKKALANYPCQQCHQHTNSEDSAPLRAHVEIRVKHMEGGSNCQTCHDEVNPEDLRLATGKTFGLDEVHELCKQCHSTQVADWEVGIHGKQVGNWLTKVQRYGCTGCHNPHQPTVDSTHALPAPPFSEFGIPKGVHQ